MQAPDAAEVGAALERVYARAEFAPRTTSTLAQLLRDIRTVVADWFRRLLEVVLPDSGSDLVGKALLVLLVLVALWAVYQLVKALWSPRHRAEPAGAVAILQEEEQGDVAQWAARAAAAARQGNLRAAALALYRAVLARLEEQGAVRFQAGKTPGDYRREVRAHAAVRNPFDTFVRQLLPTAFGPHAPQQASWEALRKTAGELGVNA